VTQIIRAADRPPVPWKNGGGTTREIAVFPPGAGMDDFLWRLSMAEVARSGPFSSFAGVERTLAVLSGRLALDGPAIARVLDDASAPCPFDGAAPVEGTPLGGAVLDLNAMTRRGRYACTMRRLAAGERADCTGTAFLVALESQVAEGTALDRLDCLRIDGPRAIVAQASALLVDFVAST
jgi:environmental stress-induced protein Ves